MDEDTIIVAVDKTYWQFDSEKCHKFGNADFSIKFCIGEYLFCVGDKRVANLNMYTETGICTVDHENADIIEVYPMHSSVVAMHSKKENTNIISVISFADLNNIKTFQRFYFTDFKTINVIPEYVVITTIDTIVRINAGGQSTCIKLTNIYNILPGFDDFWINTTDAFIKNVSYNKKVELVLGIGYEFNQGYCNKNFACIMRSDGAIIIPKTLNVYGIRGVRTFIGMTDKYMLLKTIDKYFQVFKLGDKVRNILVFDSAVNVNFNSAYEFVVVNYEDRVDLHYTDDLELYDGYKKECKDCRNCKVCHLANPKCKVFKSLKMKMKFMELKRLVMENTCLTSDPSGLIAKYV